MTSSAPLGITPPEGLRQAADLPAAADVIYQAPPWVELFADGKGLRDALELAVGTLPVPALAEGIRSIRSVTVPLTPAGMVGLRPFTVHRTSLEITYRPDTDSAENLLAIARAALAAYCDLAADPSIR